MIIWIPSNDEGERRKHFVEFFNRRDAIGLDVELNEFLTNAAHNASRAELANPASAEFVETHVRKCADGVVRAAGMMRFAGRNGSVSVGGVIPLLIIKILLGF